MEKALQDAIDITEKYEANMAALLKEKRYVNNMLTIKAHIKHIRTKLVFAGGILRGPQKKGTGSLREGKHGPIRNFMGRTLTKDKADPKLDPEAKKKSLTASQQEVQTTLKKVAHLLGKILTLPAQSIVSNYRQASDIQVVRGAAKKVGLDDYEKGKYDIEFVKRIQAAVEKLTEEGKLQAIVDEALEKAASVQSLQADKVRDEDDDDEPTEQILTQEDIDADSRLQKMKAKPGQTLVTEKGKLKLK